MSRSLLVLCSLAMLAAPALADPLPDWKKELLPEDDAWK